MYKGWCIALLLLIVLFLLILFEIGAFLTSEDFEEFVFTSAFVIFDVCLLAVVILAIWSDCQL